MKEKVVRGIMTYGSTDTVGLVGAVINSVVALRDAVVVVCAANHCEGIGMIYVDVDVV